MKFLSDLKILQESAQSSLTKHTNTHDHSPQQSYASSTTQTKPPKQTPPQPTPSHATATKP